MSTSSPPAPVMWRPTFVSPAVGKAIRMIIPYHDGVISDLEGWGDEPPSIIKIKTRPKALLQGDALLMERKGGQVFKGVVKSVDEAPHLVETLASIGVDLVTVKDCCQCRSDTASVPNLWATVRFSREDPYIIEATVRKVERQESPDRTIVNLNFPPPLPSFLPGTDDTVILETPDSLYQWEGVILETPGPSIQLEGCIIKPGTSFVEDFSGKCYPHLDGSVSIHVFDRVPLMGISIQPAPELPYKLLTPKKKKKKKPTPKQAGEEPSKDEGAKRKFKVGLNIFSSSYANIARAVVKVAVHSQDVELVAINDPSDAIDYMSCMFSTCSLLGRWKQSDTQIIGGLKKRLFGAHDVTIFRCRENDDDISSWKMTGAEFIVNISPDIDQNVGEYKSYAAKCASGSSSDDKTMSFSPLRKILSDKLNRIVVSPFIWNGLRAPILMIDPANSSGTKAIIDLLPSWNACEIRKTIDTASAATSDTASVATSDTASAAKNDTASTARIGVVGIVLEFRDSVASVPMNTKPSLDFGMFIGWCFDMICQIPEVWHCGATMA